MEKQTSLALPQVIRTQEREVAYLTSPLKILHPDVLCWGASLHLSGILPLNSLPWEALPGA